MRVFITLLVIAGISLGACSRSRRYELRGEVVQVDRPNARVTVRHEDIQGFMPAMTMTFDVSDARLVQDRQPGELIRATLIVAENRAYLSAIQRTGMAPPSRSAPPPPLDVLRDGEAIPDAQFVDQAGHARRLSEWRGQAIAVTFVYTRCPFPEFCPSIDRKFQEAQGAIAKDASLRGRAHLVSVSLDPAYDTPSVLAAHATRVSADPAHWTLLTGDRGQIGRFTARFGVSIASDDGEGAAIVHNLRTAVIDREGRIVTIVSGNEWTPSELLGHLRSALR